MLRGVGDEVPRTIRLGYPVYSETRARRPTLVTRVYDVSQGSEAGKRPVTAVSRRCACVDRDDTRGARTTRAISSTGVAQAKHRSAAVHPILTRSEAPAYPRHAHGHVLAQTKRRQRSVCPRRADCVPSVDNAPLPTTGTSTDAEHEEDSPERARRRA
ncbi:hypothetical protein EXIGLDRAFT_846401 [Exidia glandulosa HHB12029]|uniref:Uncharacterized protein n=1 Tax=Exidia glandulosa HHB12029 TaxID=1314781 RepID=A0A165AZP8_EXIGL|nr:hypothetical protein EXIGLDRAFT_846401 [Exidia glandulosa HHB12029]